MKILLTAMDIYQAWVNAPTIDYLAGLARIEAEPVAEPWTEIADTWLALYRQDATDRAAIREISYGL